MTTLDSQALLTNEKTSSPEPDPRRCLNCDALTGGDYCASCGQDARTTRITFPSLLRSLIDNVLSVDSALLRTFLALVRRPGPFIRAFLLGRRVDVARPLPYYLLVVALKVGAPALFKQVSGPRSAGSSGSFWDENFVALQLSFAYGALMLPLAAARRVLHARAGYSVAEHFVALLYVLSQSVLVLLVAQVVLWPFGIPLKGDPEGLLWLAAFTGYTLWAARGFLFEPLWKVALKLLASFGLTLGAAVVIAIVVKAAIT
jgi:hypothetical protein